MKARGPSKRLTPHKGGPGQGTSKQAGKVPVPQKEGKDKHPPPQKGGKGKRKAPSKCLPPHKGQGRPSKIPPINIKKDDNSDYTLVSY